MFLRRATRGLRPRRRAEVQAELRSHLYERQHQLVLLGLSETDATAQALGELGRPEQIARGWQCQEQVHPLLSTLVLTALVGLLLSTLPQLHWLRLTTSREGLSTTSSTEAELLAEGIWPIERVRGRLHPLGLEVQRVGVNQYRLSAPGQTAISLSDPDPSTSHCLGPLLPAGLRPTPTQLLSGSLPLYLSAYDMLQCLSGAGWPLEVQPQQVRWQGHPMPFSWTGKPLSTLERRAWITSLYAPTVTRSISRLPARAWNTTVSWMPGPLVWPMNVTPETPLRTLHSGARPGQPVLYLVKMSTRLNTPQRGPFLAPSYAIWLDWTDAAGLVTVPNTVPGEHRGLGAIRLYTTVASWQKAPLTHPSALLLPVSTRTSDPIALTPLVAAQP